MRKSKRSPSRIKYEQGHPTISCRTSKELKERIDAVKKAEGISNSEIMARGAGLSEVKAKSKEEIRQEAFYKGYGQGFITAKNRYSVTYQCSGCGQPMVVNTTEEKEAIKTYMREHGWGHAECHKQINKS